MVLAPLPAGNHPTNTTGKIDLCFPVLVRSSFKMNGSLINLSVLCILLTFISLYRDVGSCKEYIYHCLGNLLSIIFCFVHVTFCRKSSPRTGTTGNLNLNINPHILTGGAGRSGRSCRGVSSKRTLQER
jgi:hypothetical protein